MRQYEMMVIVSDTLDDDGAKAVVERIEGLVSAGGGRVLATDVWGRRPLAYEIDHRQHGYYVVFDLEVSTEALTEVERQLRISDDVVRFKTIRPAVRVHARR